MPAPLYGSRTRSGASRPTVSAGRPGSPKSISAIVRGTQPGLEICKGLAAFFGVPLEDVLRMAGHMTPAAAPAWPPEVVALVREVEGLPPPLRRAVIKAWRAVLEGIQAERDLAGR